MPVQELQVLKENGFRLTPQRRAVLAVIANHDGDLTAEEIHQEARQFYPRLSLTTVYRTLAVLKESQLVEQHYVSPKHDRSHFSLAGTSHNAHFHCLGCDQVRQLQSPEAVAALLRVLGEDVQATRVCICIEGYCNECNV